MEEPHELHPHPPVSHTYQVNLPHDIQHSPLIKSAAMPEFTGSIDHVVSPLTHGTLVDSSVWTDQLSAPTLSRFPVGPTVPVPETPKEIFKLFFTPALMEKIKEQTNKYEKQVYSPQLNNNWTETTVEELYAYFGFNFLMSLKVTIQSIV